MRMGWSLTIPLISWQEIAVPQSAHVSGHVVNGGLAMVAD